MKKGIFPQKIEDKITHHIFDNTTKLLKREDTKFIHYDYDPTGNRV